MCIFNPQLGENWTKCAKNSISPQLFAKIDILRKVKQFGKKLKQLLRETQEKIQKLKQNEHQVLSCSQKKCKIKTPALQVKCRVF